MEIPRALALKIAWQLAARGGDNGSDLHGLSQSALTLVFVLHCCLPALPAC
jgi:hypothetical protein